MQPSDRRRDAPIYNIRAVSRLTGVPADTLRRWESRYAIITPQRTESGYRLYSQRDVDTIRWLAGKLEEGLSISRACEMLRSLGGDPGPTTVPAALPSPAQQAPQTLASGVPRSFETLQENLLDAIRDVDEERAGIVMSEALGLYSVEEVCLRLLQPVLVAVGEEWLSGKISVAVEHFASAFVRTRLSNIFHTSAPNSYGPLVLVGCAPDEFHELGPMFLAIFLRRAGLKVVFLGQNVPLESLEAMIESLRPDVVCLSSTRAETAARLYPLREFLDDLQARRGASPLLAYGGQVFNRFPHISERLGGLYLGEDAGVAVRRLREELAQLHLAS